MSWLFQTKSIVRFVVLTALAGVLYSLPLQETVSASETDAPMASDAQYGSEIKLGTSDQKASSPASVKIMGTADRNGTIPLSEQNDLIKYLATLVFALAIIHTFAAKKFSNLAHRYPQGSVQENLFHLMGEVEVVFLFWSAVLIGTTTLMTSWSASVVYIESLIFTEPIFVFVIMSIAATKPIIDFADSLIRFADRFLPLKGSAGFLVTVLILGPLLGSFITEPAAMTVSALILYRQFFSRDLSLRLKYLIIAVLFVNISIGGALTHFAAPPVIMVANTWGWGFAHMFSSFGWKAIIAITINAYMLALTHKKELNRTIHLLKDSAARGEDAAEMKQAPWWVTAVHMAFLAFTVVNAHHATVFSAGFLFFLGFVTVTREYQEELKLRESLLVAGFLAGLITLGSLQDWWIQPILASLPSLQLFIGAVIMTSFTDNAALTFLASQVEGLSETKKYFVVAGALAGGGLTVIANAPNPIGYSILNKTFAQHGIHPLRLLAAASIPTLITFCAFLLLPSL